MPGEGALGGWVLGAEQLSCLRCKLLEVAAQTNGLMDLGEACWGNAANACSANHSGAAGDDLDLLDVAELDAVTGFTAQGNGGGGDPCPAIGFALGDDVVVEEDVEQCGIGGRLREFDIADFCDGRANF